MASSVVRGLMAIFLLITTISFAGVWYADGDAAMHYARAMFFAGSICAALTLWEVTTGAR